MVQQKNIGGVECVAIGDPDAALQVVLLHGRMMSGEDLAPFGQSLGIPAYFVFPSAPLAVAPHGRSWWPVDCELEAARRQAGPLDLYALWPEGRAQARATLGALLSALPPVRKRVLGGFSQGGMLAMDYVLQGAPAPSLLALLSSSRIAFDDWLPRLSRLQGLPMLVAHGRDDLELAFSAGEALRDAAVAGGAAVEWLPFDGGHGIPLVVWRALRRRALQLID
ncbi:MAG: hypothetical protein ABI538_00770 [Pseudoxanthomonas sp.]